MKKVKKQKSQTLKDQKDLKPLTPKQTAKVKGGGAAMAGFLVP